MKYLSDYLAVSGASKIYKCASVDTTARTWTGYLYNRTTGLASAAANLSYDCPIAPTVGKYYTSDGWIECNVYAADGLVFYAPLHASKTSAETGQTITEIGTPVFNTVDGILCATLDGSSWFRTTADNLPSGDTDRTISMLCKATLGQSYNIFGYGSNGTNMMYTFTVSSDGTFGIEGKMSNFVGCSSIITGAFHHVTVKHESSMEKFYVDNSLECSTEKVRATGNSWPFSIGNGCNGQISDWASMLGSICEVKVWNRAISDAEISAESARCLAMVETSADGTVLTH